LAESIQNKKNLSLPVKLRKSWLRIKICSWDHPKMLYSIFTIVLTIEIHLYVYYLTGKQASEEFSLHVQQITSWLILEMNCSCHLKWYYVENRIFPIAAILKHKQVVCMRRENAVYYFQISLFVPEIFKFLKCPN